MQDLKDYLKERLNFLREVLTATDSDNLSTLGQIHEIKNTLEWIEEHEKETEDNESCNN
jgi:hypothetical protein